jgi:hypothetical protein
MRRMMYLPSGEENVEDFAGALLSHEFFLCYDQISTKTDQDDSVTDIAEHHPE